LEKNLNQFDIDSHPKLTAEKYQRTTVANRFDPKISLFWEHSQGSAGSKYSQRDAVIGEKLILTEVML